MKFKLIPIVAVTSITLFSSIAFTSTVMAGGANCDSKKGHAKSDMSAEGWKEFKDSHVWLFSEDGKDVEKPATHDGSDKAPVPKQEDSGLVEI